MVGPRHTKSALGTLFLGAFAYVYDVIPRWQVDRGINGRSLVGVAGPQVVTR